MSGNREHADTIRRLLDSGQHSFAERSAASGALNALLAENQRLTEIAEAAEALIERTITDLTEVGRREVRLSALLRQWRNSETLAGDTE